MITTNDAFILALDRMEAEGLEIWEAAVSIGMADEADMTTRRWRYGDICQRLERKYRDRSIDQYASAVNIAASTMRQYHAMSNYYEFDTRYRFENLGYKHYRDAKRFENITVSLRALAKASDRGWPAWKFENFVTRALGKPARAEAVTGVVVTVEGFFGKDFPVVAFDEPNNWQPGDRVRIVKVAK